MKKYVMITAALISVCACERKASVESRAVEMSTDENIVVQQVTLTVAESKRLIAKGLARYAPVQEKLNDGTVIITRGSSNSYLVEEILQTNLTRGVFMTGRIQPANSTPVAPDGALINDMVLRNGIVDSDASLIGGLRSMKKGDIIFKGANLINYQEKKAALCIGHPTGGTMGQFLPFIDNPGIRLIIPVGLEKQTSQNLDELEKISRVDRDAGGKIVWVKVLPGEIFTEIEAIKQFADVQVYQLAAGGIAGAEGAVTLAIKGTAGEVEKAVAAVTAVHGEPAY